MNKTYYKKDVLKPLRKKYPEAINPQLASLVILQTEDNLYLEKSYKSEPGKFYSTAMDFIAEDEFIELEPIISASMFNTGLSLEENVDKFLNELDKETIDYCFDDIII
ncbi:hypothetical protein J0871_16465 [Salegentibacter sp. BDJ18]|uniref:hypothetical protein n=1 Tax=Salegentibacter sp. BDJ18 TaxID=2816376 RepID=UPI001AAFABCF|nr:hypothetical protein [Salegentibacter sp. BDJ18]MBO2546012.1 hypothetical protein [Salegentibacter sp. BDJ18]